MIISNSTALKIAIPPNAKNGTIHSDSTISMSSYTLKQDFTKTLNSLEFKALNEEYVDIPKMSNIAVKTPAFSVCMFLFIKTEKGANNAIFEYFYDDGKGGALNVLSIKTGSEAGTLVFAINNTSVTMNITINKWFHLCWTLEKVKDVYGDGIHLADWKIYINGKSAISLSNKVYLDTAVPNNRILLGKGHNGSDTNYLNGYLAEITLYDTAIDPKLDIYQDDPTVKYVINANMGGAGATEGFATMDGDGGGFYDYQLNRYENSEEVSNSVISDVFENKSTSYPVVMGIKRENAVSSLPEIQTNYENLGLGIFFIILSVVIYRYF
jgi:hypothetical protein